MSLRNFLAPRGARMTGLLIVTNLLVFAGQYAGLKLAGRDWAGDILALSPEGLAAGAWWQLLTYGWIHSTDFWPHIVFNLLMLRFLGPLLEFELGRWRFLGLYLGGILFSAAVWLLWNQNPQAAIGGASGAVFTLLIAGGVLYPRYPVQALIMLVLPVRTTLGRLAWITFWIELLFLAIEGLSRIPAVATHGIAWADRIAALPGGAPLVETLWSSVFQIAHAAHVGGGIFGWFAIRRLARERRAYDAWLRRAQEELLNPPS